ncbi:Fe(3+)-binding periplasmic protein [Frankia canadensis]|uniref:Fe(3+)-binding periplasmic protein n=1 Tax=Frankia canadensis TaxID=1836972 RepID=A0A2I2KQ26_9ACTN|nr:iron ABC transporter substrate-binding protein [Frankia canadensis]SNQ47771.1 Fe(3+)-binding periplasmic protein [Frankia canadensis]SOU55061.1 Fe(3+)-binding periplasmic protein [Frankia canadensis]
MRRSRRALPVLLSVTLGAALAACGGGSGADGNALTVYGAPHGELLSAMADGFTQQTGIKVNVRPGADAELANQIVQEGKASPADVIMTENSPAMGLADSRGLLARVDTATVAQVPSKFVPSSHNWVGFAARSTVLVYNTKALAPGQLPVSIMDLAQPQWRGRVGIAPSGADFQAIVSAVLALRGETATRQWLDGLKANAKAYSNNIAILKAVNSGEVAAGVSYHYYWYKDRAAGGVSSGNAELRFFGNQDPGAFLSTSGAGVLASSKKQPQAQQFLAYLTSEAGQKVLAASKAMEYPLLPSVTNSVLRPISVLDPPEVDPAKLNGPEVVTLMQKAGLL